jgi:hypothetical protein
MMPLLLWLWEEERAQWAVVERELEDLRVRVGMLGDLLRVQGLMTGGI